MATNVTFLIHVTKADFLCHFKRFVWLRISYACVVQMTEGAYMYVVLEITVIPVSILIVKRALIKYFVRSMYMYM